MGLKPFEEQCIEFREHEERAHLGLREIIESIEVRWETIKAI